MRLSETNPDSTWFPILKAICGRYEVEEKDVIGDCMSHDLVYARGIFVYWMKEFYKEYVSFSKLAQYLRYKSRFIENRGKYRFDHGATMRLYKAFRDRIEFDDVLPNKLLHICAGVRRDYEEVDKLIRGRFEV